LPKRIQDIFATRRLQKIFNFTGGFTPQVDETIVPVVVLETFQISDDNRGPVEAVASGVTVVSAVGLQPWMALIPAVQAQVPPIRPYLPVYRINRIQYGSDVAGPFEIKVTPTVPPIVGIQNGVAIWADRRFGSTLPDGFIRESNAIDGVFPAGGINVFQHQYSTAAHTPEVWRPKNLIIHPGSTLVMTTPLFNRSFRYNIEWQELDPEQTGAPA